MRFLYFEIHLSLVKILGLKFPVNLWKSIDSFSLNSKVDQQNPLKQQEFQLEQSETLEGQVEFWKSFLLRGIDLNRKRDHFIYFFREF